MSAPLDHTMIALTFEHTPELSELQKVPNHISVVPWIANRGIDLYSEVDNIAEGCGPITVIGGQLDVFGSNGHEKTGREVRSAKLHELHNRLFDRLSGLGVEFSHPEWLGENYNPHYRWREDFDPLAGYKEHTFTELTFIMNIARGDRGMKIISNHRLA